MERDLIKHLDFDDHLIKPILMDALCFMLARWIKLWNYECHHLSSKYGDMKKELEKDNKVMGHSKAVALDTYVKEAQE